MHRALIPLAGLAALFGARVARADGAGDASADAKPDPHTFVRASVGGAARALYDADVLGGEVDAGVGIDTRYGDYSIGLTFFAGTTAREFVTLHGAAGVDMAWPVGIFRFGLTPRVGYIGISRLTTDRQFGAYTFGLALHGSVDVFRKGGTTLALGLQPTGDVALAAGADGPGQSIPAPLYGGRAFLEVRYDAE